MLHNLIDVKLNSMFNIEMTDTERIHQLGGVACVAKLLGFSLQRVQNWLGRGAIPPAVKIAYPQHFLFPLSPSRGDQGEKGMSGTPNPKSDAKAPR